MHFFFGFSLQFQTQYFVADTETGVFFRFSLRVVYRARDVWAGGYTQTQPSAHTYTQTHTVGWMIAFFISFRF